MSFIKWLHAMGKPKKTIADLQSELHVLQQQEKLSTIGGRKGRTRRQRDGAADRFNRPTTRPLPQ